MRKSIALLAVSGLLLAQSETLRKLPDLHLRLLDNREVTLYTLLEKGPVLLDFWATWCEPCKQEMVHLDALHGKYAPDGLTVLTINQDSPKSLARVKSYIRSKRHRFLVVLDPNQQVGQKLNVLLLPTTILVGRDGQVLWRHQGYLPGDEVEIERRIIAALGLDS